MIDTMDMVFCILCGISLFLALAVVFSALGSAAFFGLSYLAKQASRLWRSR